VQVSKVSAPSDWQNQFRAFTEQQLNLLENATAAE
jgi:formate dehydrogenase major subunit